MFLAIPKEEVKQTSKTIPFKKNKNTPNTKTAYGNVIRTCR